MLSGKENHFKFLVISLLIASSVYGQAGKVYKYHFNGGLRKGNAIAIDQGIVINYSISELNLENAGNSHGDFYRISIPGHNPTSEQGKPELPVLSRLISVPEDCVVNIKISEVISQNLNPGTNSFKGKLYPRQRSATKDFQKQKEDFIIDKQAYSARGFIKSDTVNIEYLGKSRDKRIASLQIQPVRYNPLSNEIEVITSMKVEFSFTGGKGSSVPVAGINSALFNQSLDKGVLNFNSSGFITGYTDKPVGMVIITDPIFKKSLLPYLNWKTQKGYKLTVLYKGTGGVGNTYAQIKDTLTRIYNSASATNPAPDYLMIVGDVSIIPRSDGTNNISDMYWGEFDGNGDYLPDLYIGRLPVADTSDLKAVIRKLIQYEKFEFADTNKYYTRTLVSAGNDAGYADYMNGQVKYAVTNYLTPANNLSESHFYYPQSSSADDSIKKIINTGVGFINYTGHGDALGWLDPEFRSSDTSKLHNRNMYPFIVTNACRTAQYNTAGSLGNVMLLARDKGAIGYIGCSNDSYWDEDYYWAVGTGSPNSDPKYATTGLGALDRLFHTHGESPSEWHLTMGQINYAGNLAVSQSTSSKKKYYWETYTLLGDPSMIPITGKPDAFSISLPDTLPNGITSLSLTLPPFTYAAISHFDTLWDATFASPSGSAVLDMPGLTNDSCLVVITGQNKIPLIKKIRIANLNKEFINLTSARINDESANNNGLADYGESVFLKLTINNLGLENASDLSLKLTSTSDHITAGNDSVFIGGLAAKTQIILTEAFALKISDLIPDKEYVTLNLTIRDSKSVKNYPIDISLHSPVLDILNCLIDDTGSGNGNLLADPGETFNLIFKIRNSGSSTSSGTLGILNQPPGLTIFEPVVNTGALTPGEIKLIPVSVKLDQNFAKGGSIDINSLLDCDPYIRNKSFQIAAGKTKESFEYQRMTVFPWVNSVTYPWIITASQVSDGEYSARSAVALPNQSESELKMTVNVPMKDTIRFYVKISSETNYDFLYFRLNGTQMFSLSGESDWTLKKVALNEGFNSLEWVYKKDQSVASGADCSWLDNIIFPVLAFNQKDLKTGKVLTPQPEKSYSSELVTAEIINLGTDTVKNFNMAYRINNNPPVFQNFIKKINPADTSVISFTQPADLSSGGTYTIRVYGLNNNDNYLFNDTTLLTVVNTGIFKSVENPENMIRVSPNPFGESFRLELESNVNEEIIISLFSQTGKAVWEVKEFVLPGSNTFLIEPSGIQPGFYVLRVTGRSTLKAARIVKMK